jgi:hypothetical protein
MKAKALGIDAQIAAEIHVGSGGGLDEAAHLFARHPDFHQSAVNRRRNGEVAWYMYRLFPSGRLEVKPNEHGDGIFCLCHQRD